jgi:DeoR/GlpR family transcriptional regulator of sugar metabolism
MAMHAAKIDDSPRLQKVRDFLRRKGSATTREISQACDVYAVNSIVAELRANGFMVECKAVKGKRGVYCYTLHEAGQMLLFACPERSRSGRV